MIEFLLVTNRQDPHADAVILELNKRSVDVFRLNTEDLLEKYKFEVRISTMGAIWGTIEDEVGRILNFENLRVAWLRKPSYQYESLDGFSEGVQSFIKSETTSFLHSLYSLPNVFWVNDFSKSNMAKVKLQQLLKVSSTKIRVPETLITNKPSAALNFGKLCSFNLATKSLYSALADKYGVVQTVPTIRIRYEDLSQNIDSVKYCATMFQSYVEKSFELRIVVIENKVFAVKIDSQSHDLTKTDWRQHAHLCKHTIFSLPSYVTKFCQEFVLEQGLIFGAMDFIVTPENEYVFLENNPFGQYLWLEEATGLQLTHEICDLFVRKLSA